MSTALTGVSTFVSTSTGEPEAARRELRALLDRVAERSDLDDEQAMEIAVSEVHAYRRDRRAAKKRAGRS